MASVITPTVYFRGVLARSLWHTFLSVVMAPALQLFFFVANRGSARSSELNKQPPGRNAVEGVRRQASEIPRAVLLKHIDECAAPQVAGVTLFDKTKNTVTGIVKTPLAAAIIACGSTPHGPGADTAAFRISGGAWVFGVVLD